MAYFEKDLEGNFQYSYYGVNGIIIGDYVNPKEIEAYTAAWLRQKANGIYF